MKRAGIIVAIVGIAILVLGGCMTQFATTNGKLAYGEISGTSRGSVDVEEGFVYIIHPNLVTFGDGKTWEELNTVLEPELRAMDANAIQDMKLHYGFTTTDFLLTAIVPVVSWGTYRVEGQAVQQ